MNNLFISLWIDETTHDNTTQQQSTTSPSPQKSIDKNITRHFHYIPLSKAVVGGFSEKKRKGLVGQREFVESGGDLFTLLRM